MASSGSSQLPCKHYRKLEVNSTGRALQKATRYLAGPCELQPDTQLGDPDRLAVAGRVEMGSPKREGKRAMQADCRKRRLKIWRSWNDGP